MIKVIAFDLWKTLATREIETEPGYWASEEIKKQFQLKINVKEVIRIFEQTIQTKYWETEVDAYTELLRKLKISPTKKNILKIIAIRSKIETKMKLFDFVIPMLRKLKKKGYKIGLISNSSIFIREMIDRDTNLLKYVDYPIFSYQQGLVKPSPLIFLELLRRAKAQPEEAIMVGDSYDNDYVGAKKVKGMNAILFDGSYENLKKELKKLKVII